PVPCFSQRVCAASGRKLLIILLVWRCERVLFPGRLLGMFFIERTTAEWKCVAIAVPLVFFFMFLLFDFVSKCLILFASQRP
ncbi:hypothetical protein COCON_G00049200, partial [Conger conger]